MLVTDVSHKCLSQMFVTFVLVNYFVSHNLELKTLLKIVTNTMLVTVSVLLD